ncbi:MAG: EAL domain-containing protein [Chloroflexota bacterium]
MRFPVIVIAVVMAAVTVWQIHQQTQNLDASQQSSDTVTAAQQASVDWLLADTLAGRYIVTPLPETAFAVHSLEQQSLQNIDTAIGLAKAAGSEDQADTFRTIRAQAETAIASRQGSMDAATAGDQATAGTLLLQGLDDSRWVSAAFLGILSTEGAEAHSLSDQSRSQATIITWVILLAAAILILNAFLATFLTSRSVVRPLSRLRKTAQAIGDGDLEARAELTGPREIKELAFVVNSAAAKISERNATVMATLAELHERDAALSDSMARWRALVDNSHDLVMVVDSDQKIVFANSAVQPIFGYTAEGIVGTDSVGYAHPDDLQTVGEALARVAAGEGTSLLECRIRRADGSYADMESIASKIRWRDHDAILLNGRDVSEQKAARETIAYMAYHDELTGLPNRRLLQDRLEIAVAQSHRSGMGVCVVSVDLDHFKNINDLLGHNAGDDLLRQVATRLASLVRDGDTVARIGGDEFIIVFPESESLPRAMEATERVIGGFRRPFRIADREVHITASAGIARLPDHGNDGETLINNADLALYVVKENGRNNFRVYSAGMTTRDKEWFAMEAALRKALINGDIVVFYQPQVRVDTGQVIGAEALARWQHPERGLIMPSEFIPLAEETGLINLLGELVLRNACEEASTWPHPLRLSVNVSPRQIERPDFVEHVLDIVKDTGLQPQRLEIEITESTVLRDVDRTREVANRLSEAGILISIDDFGTGSTSLRQLETLPLHQVKIDQSFTLTLMENRANAAIIASVISLGHELNLSVIAEGVETEEQLQFLRDQKCDEFQGFLFSRPVPADEFRKIISVSPPAAVLNPA